MIVTAFEWTVNDVKPSEIPAIVKRARTCGATHMTVSGIFFNAAGEDVPIVNRWDRVYERMYEGTKQLPIYLNGGKEYAWLSPNGKISCHFWA